MRYAELQPVGESASGDLCPVDEHAHAAPPGHPRPREHAGEPVDGCLFSCEQLMKAS